MDVLSNLYLGFSVALSFSNLIYCFIGVLPGIGAVTTVAMLLPLTFSVPPESALIMLAGIYYGAQYGGSTTSILVNMPGEAASVVTTIDGYKMAQQGRAGPALGIAAIGSFFGGCVSTLVVALFAPALATVALQFDPDALAPEHPDDLIDQAAHAVPRGIQRLPDDERHQPCGMAG